MQERRRPPARASGPIGDAVGPDAALLELAPGIALRRGQPGRHEQVDDVAERRRGRPARRHLAGERRQRLRRTRRADRRRTARRPPRRRPAPPSAPWTSAVTSSASARWAAPPLGRRGVLGEQLASISASGRSENIRNCCSSSSSSSCIQCWWNWYGDVFAGSSHSRAPVVLPSFVPSAASQQRPGQGVHRRLTLAPDQVDAGRRCCPTGRTRRSAARSRGGRAATGSRWPAAACS